MFASNKRQGSVETCRAIHDTAHALSQTSSWIRDL